MSEQEDLRELCVQFAKDFNVSYDKISMRKTHVAYRFETGGTGGWSEGTPGTSVPYWIIKRHYELVNPQHLYKEPEA